MKGIILEKEKDLAAVLREDGIVCRMVTDRPVGETVTIMESRDPAVRNTRRRRTDLYRRVVAAAVALVMAVAGTGWNYLTVQACTTVTWEDSGIRLTLNRLDQVIEVEALDEESEAQAALLKERHVEDHSLKEAAAMTQDALQEIRGGEVVLESPRIVTKEEGRLDRLDEAAREGTRIGSAPAGQQAEGPMGPEAARDKAGKEMTPEEAGSEAAPEKTDKAPGSEEDRSAPPQGPSGGQGPGGAGDQGGDPSTRE